MAETSPTDASTRSPRAKEPTRATDKSQEKPLSSVDTSSRQNASKRNRTDDESEATEDEQNEKDESGDKEGEEQGRESRKRDSLAMYASARRPVVFLPSHALKFGLEVVARDAKTEAVKAVLCLFCKNFGREPKEGAKRRATTNFKYFKGVFRTDQYLQHLRLQHPLKWAEYEAASVNQKLVFFPRYVMHVDLKEEYEEEESEDGPSKPTKAKKQKRTGGSGRGADKKAAEATPVDADYASDREYRTPPSLVLAIPSMIVKLLRGETPFEPRALLTGGGSSEAVSDSETNGAEPYYRVSFADRLAFDVATDLCASGLSTAQITRSMHAMAKYVPSSAGLASVWDELVDNYAEVATLGSLSMLSALLVESWAFSIGIQRYGDSSSYVNVHVRFAVKKLRDFHLCRLPVANLKESLPEVLDVVHPHWRKSLIGISVDGDVFASETVVATMWTLQVCATLGESVRLVWNGSALLNRAFGNLFAQLMDGEFAATLHGLKTYVKSHSALIQEIGHEYQAGAPPSRTHDEGSLESIVMVARWLSEKRVRIRKFLDEDHQHREQHPKAAWWLCLAVFDSIASSAFRLSGDLRPTPSGMRTMKGQIESVAEHTSFVSTAFKVEATSEETTPSVIRYKSSEGTLATTKTSMLEFVVELGSFVNSLLTSLRDDALEELVKSLGGAIATYVETLTTGCEHAKTLSTEGAVATLSQVGELSAFPQELAKIGGKEFDGLLGPYRSLLRQRFSDEELDLIEQEHQALKRTTREKEFLTWTVNSSRDCLSQFDATWSRTLGRFRVLHAFVAGLATIFPREAVVSHTPGTRSETNKPSGSMLDVQVEAPLHAAQFLRLQRSLVVSEPPTTTSPSAESIAPQSEPDSANTTTVII